MNKYQVMPQVVIYRDMFNKDEVDSYKYMRMEDIQKDLEINEHMYTPWFKIAIEKLTITN